MAIDFYSREFEDGDELDLDFTCDGENVSPTFFVSGVDDEVQSLVMIMDDPDSPKGNFLHWMVWNIDPKVQEFSSMQLPDGAIEGYNDFGKSEYGGPCPHSGTHRYFFRLYALDDVLELEEDVTREELEKEIAGHIVDEAVLMAVYSKR